MVTRVHAHTVHACTTHALHVTLGACNCVRCMARVLYAACTYTCVLTVIENIAIMHIGMASAIHSMSLTYSTVGIHTFTHSCEVTKTAMWDLRHKNILEGYETGLMKCTLCVMLQKPKFIVIQLTRCMVHVITALGVIKKMCIHTHA